MLKVIPGNDIPTINRQIEALEWVLSNDTNAKDKSIHSEPLNVLKAKLKELQSSKWLLQANIEL